jgi:hypothetical protein
MKIEKKITTNCNKLFGDILMHMSEEARIISSQRTEKFEEIESKKILVHSKNDIIKLWEAIENHWVQRTTQQILNTELKGMELHMIKTRSLPIVFDSTLRFHAIFYRKMMICILESSVQLALWFLESTYMYKVLRIHKVIRTNRFTI